MSVPTPTPDALANRAATAFAAYRDGDVHQMGHLVDLLTPILWRTARSQRASVTDSEEAVQTAWLRLVDHADRIADPQAVLGWLIVTVKREAWRSVRRDRRERPGVEDWDAPIDAPGPESASLLSERQTILWGHITALSPVCQHLLSVIAYAPRPDYAAVAEHLGVPIGSIGPTRGRCLGKLRRSLSADRRWTE